MTTFLFFAIAIVLLIMAAKRTLEHDQRADVQQLNTFFGEPVAFSTTVLVTLSGMLASLGVQSIFGSFGVFGSFALTIVMILLCSFIMGKVLAQLRAVNTTKHDW